MPHLNSRQQQQVVTKAGEISYYRHDVQETEGKLKIALDGKGMQQHVYVGFTGKPDRQKFDKASSNVVVVDI